MSKKEGHSFVAKSTALQDKLIHSQALCCSKTSLCFLADASGDLRLSRMVEPCTCVAWEEVLHPVGFLRHEYLCSLRKRGFGGAISGQVGGLGAIIHIWLFLWWTVMLVGRL